MDVSKLFDYQIKDVEDLFRIKTGILSEKIGAGKSICAMALMDKLWQKCLADKVLVVAPLSIIPQWCQMIYDWMGQTAFSVYGGTGQKNREYQYRTFKESLDYNILIVGYQTLLSDYRQLADFCFKAIFFDEATFFKNRFSKTATACRIVSSFADYKIAISGAPLQNNLLELFSIMEVVNSTIFPSFDVFKARYCIEEIFIVPTHHKVIKYKKITGHKNVEELRPLVKTYCVSNGRDEVLSKYPAVVVENYYVELTFAQRRKYKEIQSGYASFGNDVRYVNALERLIRLLEVCDTLKLVGEVKDDSAKINEVLRLLTGELKGTKVLIYSAFKETIYSIQKELEKEGIRSSYITGDVFPLARSAIQKDFNEGTLDVLMITTAGEVGLNLQGSSCIVMMDRDWNWAVNAQIIGRINRVGQKSPTIAVLNIIAKDTVDEKVFAVLEQKKNLVNDVMDANYTALGLDEIKCILRGG